MMKIENRRVPTIICMGREWGNTSWVVNYGMSTKCEKVTFGMNNLNFQQTYDKNMPTATKNDVICDVKNDGHASNGVE